MKYFYHPLTAISTIGVMLCTLTSPTIAAEKIFWLGEGRVVSGPGYKGNLRLALTKTGNRVTFHSGPDRNKSVLLAQSSVRTSSGYWQFSRCGDRSEKLCVTLRQSRPNREIYYLLRTRY